MAIIAEELARKSFDFFTAYGASVFCGLNLPRNGTPEQCARYLPKLIAGDIRMCVSMSEPDAGSDTGAMRSTARRDGECWRINGQKLWSTGAGARDTLINVYVKTDTKVHYREGISLFLIDNDAPGVELRKLDMLGRRCVGTYEIFFNDVEAPTSALSAASIAGSTACSPACRSSASPPLPAIAARPRRRSISRSTTRRPASSSGVRSGRSRRSRTCWRTCRPRSTPADSSRCARPGPRRRGGDALREISMAKLFASETYVKVANAGMQVLGAYGYNMEFDMQRHFRDARAATIGAGTSQIQRNLIAGRMGLKVQ